MNAFPSPAHQTGADEPAPDPSMEEILASIRRIIADDQGQAPQARPATRPTGTTSAPPPSPPVQRHERPVTVEAEILAPAPRVEPQQAYAQPAPHAQVYAQQAQPYAQPAPQPYAEPQRSQPQQHYAPPAPPQSAPAAQHAQPSYAPATPVQPQPDPVQQQPAFTPPAYSAPAIIGNSPGEAALLSAQADASVSGAFEALTRSMVFQNSPFMEETVRDLLRPMLKQWLDDNLPPLVERLVRSEIERVARGGR